MKKLLKNGVAGVAALLLAAAAIALLVFAFATLLGVAAVLGLVAAGQDAASTADLLPRMTHLLLLILLYGSLSLYWAGRRRAEFDRKLSQ